MPDLFQKATRFYHERPGLICLLCVAAIPILAFLRVVLEETPLDEKRTWRDQRALEAVESSLITHSPSPSITLTSILMVT